MESSSAGADNPETPPATLAASKAAPESPLTLSAPPPRIPSLRSTSGPPMTSVTGTAPSPLSTVNAARRPVPVPGPSSSVKYGVVPQDIQDKMKAFHLSRQGAPPINVRLPGSAAPGQPAPILNPGGVPLTSSPASGAPRGAVGAGIGPLRIPPGARPQPPNWTSAPAIPGAARAQKPSLGARRGMQLPGGLPGVVPGGPPAATDRGAPPSAPNEASTAGTDSSSTPSGNEAVASPIAQGVEGSNSLFSKFSNYVDTKTGSLKFAGKAVIHGKGVDFSSGSSFSISLDEVDNLEELGKGNYGTVYRVRHSRPQIRRPGLGLQGNKPHPSQAAAAAPSSGSIPTNPGTPEKAEFDSKALDVVTSPRSGTPIAGGTTGIIMAMKEIRLELDEAKFAAIIMELDILHRCVSPFIVDFYGAFFQEGAVYICMEFMNGGSIDKLYAGGIPEPVLRKIALSTVMGLKSLKEEHNIIHRDVKPTNILVNTRGQVKICDFGVSGNLVASIAKTNIGCQSYMAPERIASGGMAQAGANPGGGTYSVQSDIWSLGLSIIECAMGQYPYAPETYSNIFSQLSAIVDGEPPDLPEEGFTLEARDFVRGCLNKIPNLRPTYAMLLRHPWLAQLLKPPTITEEQDESAEAMQSLKISDVKSPDHADTADKEVADWVAAALARRKGDTKRKSSKPALHAVPLDAVPGGLSN
ncbi:MAG: hypothetical protein M1825_000157 [Sarcosagium campestre]|nr:MAG: hypothetical protein M1825_000157 [Sarcosagium campestre]